MQKCPSNISSQGLNQINFLSGITAKGVQILALAREGAKSNCFLVNLTASIGHHGKTSGWVIFKNKLA